MQFFRYPENCPPVRVGVWVKLRVSFRFGGQPDNCQRGKLPPRLWLLFGLRLVLGLGGQFSSGAIFSNSARRYVVEEKLQQSKVKSQKYLLLNITTFVKFILLNCTCYTCYVQLTCHVFSIFVLGFKSLIINKLKNTLNCRLKLKNALNCRLKLNK